MKTLPQTRRWAGDGFTGNPSVFTQLRRNERVALYERRLENSGELFGYEVFVIRVMRKGRKVFDTVLTDDQETYPTAESFGVSAWFVMTLERAEALFTELTQRLERRKAEREALLQS